MLVLLASKFHPFIGRARLPPAAPSNSWGVPTSFPGQMGRVILSEYWVHPGVLSQLDMSENPIKEVSWVASWSSARTTSIGVFCLEKRQLSSKLVTLSLRLSPGSLQRKHFSCLYPQAYSFSHNKFTFSRFHIEPKPLIHPEFTCV